MIWESPEWKNYLRRLLRDLNRKVYEPGEEVPFLVERNTIIIAFTTRKLIENNKVTDQLISKNVKFRTYPKINKAHHDRARHMIDPEFWNLESNECSSFTIRDLCNEIIHSDVLTWVGDEKRLTGFVVASENRASKRLIDVPFDTFFQLVRLVIDDSVNSISYRFDETGKITHRSQT